MTSSASAHNNTGTTAAGVTVIECLRSGSDKLSSLHGMTAPSVADATNRDVSHDLSAVCRLEAEVLLAHVLGKSQSWLYAWPEQTISPPELMQYRQLLEQRCSGKPVAYLTGRQEFWSMSFKVSPAVLIPRPETELLVEIAIDYLTKQQLASDSSQSTPGIQPNQSAGPARILELGTGSGAIAIALASELPGAEITATDISLAALDTARNNAQRLLKSPASQVIFVQSDWFQQLTSTSTTLTTQSNGAERYQLIVSNPPYIRADDPHLSKTITGISYEPHAALVAQDNGLQALRKIIEGAVTFLDVDAMLAVEHGYDQAEAVRQLFQQAGYSSIESRRDLAGVERVTLGKCQSIKL